MSETILTPAPDETPDSADRLPDLGDRYRALLDAIDFGYCIIQVRFDAAGQSVDYRFLETNAAFTAQTGLTDVVGRWMRDLVPQHEQVWFDRYGEVARTGIAQRFEHSAAALEGRWFEVHAFRIGQPADRLVGILFTDTRARRDAEAMLRASEARFRAIAELNPDALLILARNRIAYANPAAVSLLRAGSADELIGRLPLSFIAAEHHVEVDRGRQVITEQQRIIRAVEQRWRRLDGTPFVAEITAGALAWEGHAGIQVIVRDVTQRKELEARQMLLAREVDHRAKNVLSVVQAVMQLTRADSVADFVQRVESRIAALARVHRVLASGGWRGAGLRTIVASELEPYGGEEGGRITIAGPDVRLRADAVQPLTMMLHELATNAAKYGALAEPGGRVEIAWTSAPDGGLALSWTEQGGPAIAGPPDRRGFGSQLIETTADQLDGEAALEWLPAGLCCRVVLPAGNFEPGGLQPAGSSASR